MISVFMDNYRGFTETLIPLRNATFLVGENSTGKSSFLSLIYFLSSPQFWLGQEFSLGDFCSLGGFEDIVSVAAKEKEYFSIGMLYTQKLGENKKKSDYAFTIMTFRNEEGLPRLHRCIQYAKKKLLTILLSNKEKSYKIINKDCPGSNEKAFQAFFLNTYKESINNTKDFKLIPTFIPSRAPLPVILAMLKSIDKELTKKSNPFVAEIPSFGAFSWLAPIRTRPHRTYDGFKIDFSPEGNHTPYIIRKTLESGDKAKEFEKHMRAFGEESGLFTNVKARSFGNHPSAPFEVTIEICKNYLNISNVGYGVSQVLPVIVEILTSPKRHCFAIQQPEVHLHPRAQAALGDLIYLMTKEKQHRYIIETHSEYLIDRFRLRTNKDGKTNDAQIVFFDRNEKGNKAHVLQINNKGQYPSDQPDSFRRFFLNEELGLLEI